MNYRMIVATFLVVLLVGCATQPLKAPCDEHASFCGSKTKINQW